MLSSATKLINKKMHLSYARIQRNIVLRCAKHFFIKKANPTKGLLKLELIFLIKNGADDGGDALIKRALKRF